MRRFLAVVVLLVLAAAATSQMVLRLNYVDTRTADGETEVLEEGSLYFAPDGRFRHDVERPGERTTEIMLPLSEERVKMNHAERTAVREWQFGIPVTLERTIRVVRDGAVSVEERRRVTATVQVPLDEDLFSVAEGYEVEAP